MVNTKGEYRVFALENSKECAFLYLSSFRLVSHVLLDLFRTYSSPPICK
jgi:hypothetical protein